GLEDDLDDFLDDEEEETGGRMGSDAAEIVGGSLLAWRWLLFFELLPSRSFFLDLEDFESDMVLPRTKEKK
ncbi:MAG: hypothetical protein C0522_14400, partial [Rhodocyclaceae bacterium]|nr:hypothetical protein [Rhodocyclaceae bacterium]